MPVLSVPVKLKLIKRVEPSCRKAGLDTNVTMKMIFSGLFYLRLNNRGNQNQTGGHYQNTLPAFPW